MGTLSETLAKNTDTPSVEKARQEFNDACWGLHTPGTVNLERGVGGIYLDANVEKMWLLWRIAKNI